jgi:hypothetical protein
LNVLRGQNEFTYPLFLPPWMEVGRTSRIGIQGVGVVFDGGEEHEISYSAIEQNDQIITVLETGRLGVTIDRSTLVALPNTSAILNVAVSRAAGITGLIKVELVMPEHMHGVSAEPVLIPSGLNSGSLTIHFAASQLGPFNMPLLVRAGSANANGPVVGETKVILVEAKR